MSEIVGACLSQFHDDADTFELLLAFSDGREFGYTVSRQVARRIASEFANEFELANARNAALEEAEKIAYDYECSLADYGGSVDAKHFYEGGVGDAAVGISKAIRSIRAEGSDRWQPIETAPKDGTKVLLCGGVYHGAPFPGYWEPSPYAPDQPWMTVIGRSRLYEHVPSHWMPLPAPPIKAEGESR